MVSEILTVFRASSCGVPEEPGSSSANAPEHTPARRAHFLPVSLCSPACRPQPKSAMVGRMNQSSGRQETHAVIFDLDGTLTRPDFDFDVMRRQMGLPANGQPILETLALMSSSERAEAERILNQHEAQVAETCELWEDALDVLAAIRKAGMRLGLLTRNSRRSADLVTSRHAMTFDCVHTREDGPVKPSPDAILKMCSRWACAPRRRGSSETTSLM